MAMDKGLERKLGDLRKRIRKLDSALVAFSGGVDSSFLMRICREELGEKAVAVTALSENYPLSELSLAKRVARIMGIRHVVVDPVLIQAASQPQRCRRGSIYSSLKSLAMRMQLSNVLDGSHKDDAASKGASFLAARRAGVKSPLLESNISKAEVRLLARELGLPNWDKEPSSSKAHKKAVRSILAASRTGSRAAAEYLTALGYDVTVRAKGKTLIIFTSKRNLLTLAEHLACLEKKMKRFGFSEVSLRLSG